MKRIVTIGLAACALVAFVAMAHAQTPSINGAVVNLRVFNDCPVSTATTSGGYPNIVIDDQDPFGCAGGLNLHNWQFSADGGATAAQFPNWCNFKFGADVSVSGAVAGGDLEGGLLVSPWWSLGIDGRFMINPGNGEIATFGGRLPFTSNHASGYPPGYFVQPDYVNGAVIHMAIQYIAGPVDPTISGIPAQITYSTVNGGLPYSFGPLAFDQANTSENPPHGLWGFLQPTTCGGYLQKGHNGGVTSAHGEWNNISFEDLTVTPAKATSWGALKTLYR